MGVDTTPGTMDDEECDLGAANNGSPNSGCTKTCKFEYRYNAPATLVTDVISYNDPTPFPTIANLQGHPQQ